MTTEEARQHFDYLLEQAKTAEQVAKLELAREYFTNPDFRASLQNKLFDEQQPVVA